MIRALAVLCLAVTMPAVTVPALGASPAPGVLPLRDVTVTYRASGAAVSAIPSMGAPGSALDMRAEWSAGQGRLLLTSTDRPQRVLLDVPGRQVTILDDGMRVAIQVPIRDSDWRSFTLADARLTRRGQDSVAGEACTDWAVQASRFHGTVCLSDDHVPLRVEGEENGQRGLVVATAVDRSSVNPADLALPSGYERLGLPRFDGR